MKPRLSASAPSAPEAEPEWAHKVRQRRGVLIQGPSAHATEVLCIDVRGSSLLLTHLTGPHPTPEAANCQLQFADASGIFQLSGTLTGEDEVLVNRTAHKALHFEVDPESTTHLNRRSSYRIGVTLKGELALLDREEMDVPTRGDGGDRGAPTIGTQDRLVELSRLIRSRKRPCIVQDLSLGGARVVLPAPAPRAGQTALLDVALERGDVLRNISGTVVQGGSSGGRREFGAHARLRFASLPGQTETRLARLISQVQLETLRQGVRDRR